MKNCLLFLLMLPAVISCNKDDDAVKTDHFKSLVYRIQTQDSNLYVEFMRGVYEEDKKGNIAVDTTFVAPGLYNIPATVLKGQLVVLFAQSNEGPGFNLKIVEEGGKILGETDSITYYPANQLQPEDIWISKVMITP